MNMRIELEKKEGEKREGDKEEEEEKERGILVTSEVEIRCLPFQGSQIRKECTAGDTIQPMALFFCNSTST